MFTTAENNQIALANPYFFAEIPDRVEAAGSYATDNKGEPASFYLWNHGLGEVISALIEAGLTIEFMHEFPYAARAKFPFMEKGEDGWWRLPSQYVQIPFLFSLQARKSELK
jgi:hypothetical protein